jgi:hypothetical protein
MFQLKTIQFISLEIEANVNNVNRNIIQHPTKNAQQAIEAIENDVC